MAANCAGIEVVLPAAPRDVKGLIRTALLNDNPTLFLTHDELLAIEGEVPDADYAIPFGKADVKRRGKDVTVVATSLTLHNALEAARVLAREGIDVEVVDPRTAVPLDVAGICRSVRKTGHLVTVDEAIQTCSIGSEIAAAVVERAFAALKAPILRVARGPAPIPFSPSLEKVISPTAKRIAAVVRKVLS